MAGGARPSAKPGASPIRPLRFWLLLIAVTACGAVFAQALYKYQDADGEWVYSDRPPADTRPVEIRELPVGYDDPSVVVTHRLIDGQVRIAARNDFHAPVEVVIALDKLENIGFPPPDESLRWVVPARSREELIRLDTITETGVPDIRFRYIWLPGDPRSEHEPPGGYRAPFAVAREFTVSQAFPIAMTHTTVDSRYAVDIAMPIGTDVYAARRGTIVEVASTNFRGGFDTSRTGASANMIRILHDDGTFAVYAHLNWNSIRVRPGDVVDRGEYIAESGNTGFSSGPHLHFAIIVNRGLRLESVPFAFEGVNGAEISPQAGDVLTAY